MSATVTMRNTAQAVERRRGSVLYALDNRENRDALPLPASEKSFCELPGGSAGASSGDSNTSNCSQDFYSFAELAARWRVSRPALYNILRGYPVLDFAPAPGRKGHKIVSREVVRQIERERERVMR